MPTTIAGVLRFGGPPERERALAQARTMSAAIGTGPEWVVAPMRAAGDRAASGSAGLPDAWAEATCATVANAEQRAVEAPAASTPGEGAAARPSDSQ